MRKLFTAMFCCVVVVTTIFAVGVYAQDVDNFSLSSFEADYYLQRDNNGVGFMRIEERIVAEFPERDQNHGIERSIPKEYEGNGVELEVSSVTDGDDQARPYTAYDSGGQTVVRIGNPNVYVRGQQIYNLTYTVRNVVLFEDGYDELFWDVNGTDWRVPIDSVVARVHLGDELAAARTDFSACVTGAFGETEDNCTVQADQDLITVSSTTPFSEGENLSFALRFADGTFAADPWLTLKRYLAYAVTGLPLLAAGWMGRKWWREGRDVGETGVIVPQYTPPQELNVVESGMILEHSVKPKHISAQLVAMAVDGVVLLHEAEKDKLIGKDLEYEVELVKSASERPQIEQDIAAALFGSTDSVGKRVKLKDKANSLSSVVKETNKRLASSLTTSNYFRSNPRLAAGAYLGIGSLVGFAGFMLAAGLDFWPIIISTIVGSVAFGGFALAMPALSAKGSQAKEYLLGVKDYVELAEAERIKFLQSPEGAGRYGEPSESGTKIKLFETLLPYAMLFGLERQWAEEFSDLYGQDKPQWADTANGQFSAAHFGGTLAGFSTSANTAFSPAKSSGSSSGGFSGGGSSGGGGGGGGGGGW